MVSVYGVELRDVSVTLEGKPVVQLERLRLDYNLFHLITSGIYADEIRLVKPAVYLRHDGDGWSIARLIKRQEQEADRQGPPYPIAVDKLTITDGVVTIDEHVGNTGVDLPDRIE